MVLTKGLRKRVLSYLHSDCAPDDPAARKQLEATFQEFSSLKFVEGD
jgi:hypothetical protein